MTGRKGCIGICIVNGAGDIKELQREYFRQGWIFKDPEAFRDREDAPCYVPELNDTVYTKQDFLELCNGQEEIAQELFGQLDWQSPPALFNEWEEMGEIETCRQCGKLFLAFGAGQCPYCGRDREDGQEAAVAVYGRHTP